jgi:ADP-heptose:LPS heptosyltransferase
MLSLRHRALKKMDRVVGPWMTRHVKPRSDGIRRIAKSPSRDRKGPAVPPDEVGNILVIRPGGLGDAALTFPMLTALDDFYPKSTIVVLAEMRNAGVYAACPIVDAVLCYDQKPLWTLNRLRHFGFDVIIDTEQFHHFSTLIANLLKPTYLCGFDTLSRSRLHTHAVAYSDETYEALSFLGLAEALTGEPVHFDLKAPFISAPPDEKAWARKTLSRSNSRSVAVVMPGATSVYRLWPASRYARTVRWLVERGLYVVIIGDKDAVPASRSIAEGLMSSGHILNLVGRTTLLQSLALLEKGRICLCADTGILHLAYGAGTPTVSLFGPGNLRKWAPPDSRHIAVWKEMACSPCTQLGHTPSCSHSIACMEKITVRDVTSAIERVLAL